MKKTAATRTGVWTTLMVSSFKRATGCESKLGKQGHPATAWDCKGNAQISFAGPQLVGREQIKLRCYLCLDQQAQLAQHRPSRLLADRGLQGSGQKTGDGAVQRGCSRNTEAVEGCVFQAFPFPSQPDPLF